MYAYVQAAVEGGQLKAVLTALRALIVGALAAETSSSCCSHGCAKGALQQHTWQAMTPAGVGYFRQARVCSLRVKHVHMDMLRSRGRQRRPAELTAECPCIPRHLSVHHL